MDRWTLAAIGSSAIAALLWWVALSRLYAVAKVSALVGPFQVKVRVSDGRGRGLVGWELSVVNSYTGRPHPVPFGNYTGRGSLVGNSDGEVLLKLENPWRYGGTRWWVMWLFPVTNLSEPRLEVAVRGKKIAQLGVQKAAELGVWTIVWEGDAGRR